MGASLVKLCEILYRMEKMEEIIIQFHVKLMLISKPKTVTQILPNWVGIFV